RLLRQRAPEAFSARRPFPAAWICSAFWTRGTSTREVSAASMPRRKPSSPGARALGEGQEDQIMRNLDIATLRSALEGNDAARMASLFADRATLKIIDSIHPPSHPLELTGRGEIAEF